MFPSMQGFDADIIRSALSLIGTIGAELDPDLAYDAYRRRVWYSVGRDRDGMALYPTSRDWFDRANNWVRNLPRVANKEESEADRPLLLKCRQTRRTGTGVWRTSVGYSQEAPRAVLSTEGELSCVAWISCLSAAVGTFDTPPRILVVPPFSLAIEKPFLRYCRSAGLTPMLQGPP